MKRDLVLASAAIVLCFASACGGAIAEPDGEGTSYGLGPNGSGRGTAGDDDADDGEDGDFRPGGHTSGGGRGGDTGTGSDDGPWGGPSSGGGSTGGFPGGTTTGGACFSVQDNSVCADMGSAKGMAAKVCANKGYDLAALTIDANGGCTVTCCDGAYPGPGPTPTPLPPPPPPPEKCAWTAVGDGSTCMSWSDLKSRIQKACASMNAEVRSVYPAGDCVKGTTTAKVECCSY